MKMRILNKAKCYFFGHKPRTSTEKKVLCATGVNLYGQLGEGKLVEDNREFGHFDITQIKCIRCKKLLN